MALSELNSKPTKLGHKHPWTSLRPSNALLESTSTYTESTKCTMMECISRPTRQSYSASGRQMPKLPVHSRSYPLARQRQPHEGDRQIHFRKRCRLKVGRLGSPRRCRCNSCHRCISLRLILESSQVCPSFIYLFVSDSLFAVA